MQRINVTIILCWVVTALILITFVLLPSYLGQLSDKVKQGNVFIRILYSILLSHPCLRAMQQLKSNNAHTKNDALSSAGYRAIGLGLEYLISRGGYLFIGLIIMLLALRNIFVNLQILHILVVILYGFSILLLDLGLDRKAS